MDWKVITNCWAVEDLNCAAVTRETEENQENLHEVFLF
jgi:hypothetical protein